MSTSPRVRLGPKHKYYSEPIAQPFYTLSQLLRQYGMEHDRRAGKACTCLLCADLRAHVEAHKVRRDGGRR